MVFSTRQADLVPYPLGQKLINFFTQILLNVLLNGMHPLFEVIRILKFAPILKMFTI